MIETSPAVSADIKDCLSKDEYLTISPVVYIDNKGVVYGNLLNKNEKKECITNSFSWTSDTLNIFSLKLPEGDFNGELADVSEAGILVYNGKLSIPNHTLATTIGAYQKFGQSPEIFFRKDAGFLYFSQISDDGKKMDGTGSNELFMLNKDKVKVIALDTSIDNHHIPNDGDLLVTSKLTKSEYLYIDSVDKFYSLKDLLESLQIKYVSTIEAITSEDEHYLAIYLPYSTDEASPQRNLAITKIYFKHGLENYVSQHLHPVEINAVVPNIVSSCFADHKVSFTHSAVTAVNNNGIMVGNVVRDITPDGETSSCYPNGYQFNLNEDKQITLLNYPIEDKTVYDAIIPIAF